MFDEHQNHEATERPLVLDYARPRSSQALQIRQPVYGAFGLIAGVLQLAFGMALLYASVRLAVDPPREIAFAAVVCVVGLGCAAIAVGTSRTAIANIRGRDLDDHSAAP